MKILRLFLFSVAIIAANRACADDDLPTISPSVTYFDSQGEELDSMTTTFSAPLTARFEANPENVGGYVANYEWRFTKEGEEAPYLTRYEEDTEYTFRQAGTHAIVLYATFVDGNDTIAYTQDYWDEVGPMRITISESRLEMPNAFSPNGDGKNDVYKAKQGWQSLVEFHAAIYNRWGQKLFEWDDPDDGWDGTFNGSDVKQGVYFVEVNAKGADGRRYHIRRDVNLLRGFRERDGTVTE